MLVDMLQNLGRYERLVPAIGRIREFLATTKIEQLPDGRHEIDGARLYLLLAEGQGKGEVGARLEAHRRYADIQVTLAGHEVIGWRPLPRCTERLEVYDPARDIEFLRDAPDCWIPVLPGHFALFLPEDAHAPLAGRGPNRKAVFKILVAPSAE